MHTEMMSSKPLQTPPILDSSLLAQIKMLTDQLLSKTSDSTPPPQNSQTNSGLSISTVGDGGGNSGGGDGGGGGSSMSSVEESGSVPPIKKSSEPCFNKVCTISILQRLLATPIFLTLHISCTFLT